MEKQVSNHMERWCKKALSIALAAALGLGLATPALGEAQTQEEGTTTIRILGTSDLHGNIWGYSYEDQKETENNGLARVNTYVSQQREEDPQLLLLDVGDAIQGTILTDDLYNKKNAVRAEEEHVMMTAMNAMNFDAMTLGNHEFNFGIDLIKRLQEDAAFPILSANTTYKEDGSFLVEPYTIIERYGLRIGVIGVTTPMIPRWDGEKVDALQFGHMGEVAAQYAKELKEEQGADIVIVLAHAGWVPEYDEENKSDGAISVAELSEDVDAMVIGHAHITFTEENENMVVGAPRSGGREVVKIELVVKENNGQVEVVNHSVEVVDMEGVTPDQKLRETVAEPHQATLDFINGGGDGTNEMLEGKSGVFGIAAIDFQPVNEIEGIPEGKLRDTGVMDLINNVQLKYSGADVSAAALFKDTSNLKQGDITYANIFDIYKFDNQLYRVTVTGKELKAYMEWSAACYNSWKPGDISISFNPEKPGYLYDMFQGVDYKIDLSKPEGSRIVDVMFKGEPLQDDQILTLCVNNYRYSSALKTDGLIAGTKEWESSGSIRDYLVEYIIEQGEISPQVDNNWEIIGVDLESPYRDEVITMVNEGKLDVPYSVSLNVDELLKEGVIKEK